LLLAMNALNGLACLPYMSEGGHSCIHSFNN
jgi:hypothetical protein